MKRPSVTAVIPCYNHGHYVEQAVDSILAQTCTDIRVVVVNDGSTDPHTNTVLQHLQRPRTQVLHTANGHLSAARNRGIKAAPAEMILTLDADDYFEPTFVEKALAVLEQAPDVAAVTCGVRFFGARQGILHPTGGSLSDFLVRNCARASALFRYSCWEEAGGYDETMKKGYEDWDFWLRLTSHGWRVHALEDILLNYRCAESSMVTGSDAIRPELVADLVRKHLPEYREHVVQVIHEKETQIQALEQRLDHLRGSTAYRIGRSVTEPFSVLGAAWKRLRRKQVD